jgi:uncharacterized protein YrrD
VKALIRGTDLVGLPVVTLSGDDIAEVRDVVFDAKAGQVVGFSLNKRGRFSGRMKESLLREQVRAVGPAAVIVAADVGLSVEDLTGGAASGNVIADRVMTDSGVQVGTVTDVVVDTATGAVVGYEVLPVDEPDGRNGRRSYLPLPETGAVSGEALIVPATAVDYVTSDLAGFAEAVDRYRELLRGRT